MANPIKVLTGPPAPDINPNTPATEPVKSYIDRLLSYYTTKTDFSENSNTTTCYVLDGGDSGSQPCDDS
jgi:hypothetical protein